MKAFCLLSVVIISINYAQCDDSNTENTDAYCFKFTWLGPLHNEESLKEVKCNSTKYKGVPCIEPLNVTFNSMPPNTTDIWAKKDRSYMCPLLPGLFCIKYSFVYNTQVLNITRYCGKIIEDRATTIEPGCYSQEIDGHTIEACACQTRNNASPCNNSVKYNCCIVLIFLCTLLTHISSLNATRIAHYTSTV